MELTASLVSLGIASDVLAVATCTGGVSGGSICDQYVNAASTIDAGSSEAAVVSVAVPVTDAAATSALRPTAVACSASASSASAVRAGTARSRRTGRGFSL